MKSQTKPSRTGVMRVLSLPRVPRMRLISLRSEFPLNRSRIGSRSGTCAHIASVARFTANLANETCPLDHDPRGTPMPA